MINFFMICTMLVLALCGLTSAHIKMAFPVPFDVANLDTSPLQPSGSDYPCKKSSYKITAMNKIPVNEAVLLDFKGTAIHNGGTCQLSITMDEEPTVDSTFKVIQTFEGGCPTAEGAGGLTFNIPKEFPTAKRATLAWTWFNQIGNREMYMNCAPIEVTGGSDNMDYFNSLPDMFKANIGNGCTTAENGDPIVPSPGQFVIKSSSVKPLDVSCSGAAGSQTKQQTPTVPNLAAYGPPAKDANQIEYVDGSSGSGSGSGGAASSAPGGNNGMYTQPAASSAHPSSAPTAGGNSGQYSQPAVSPAQPSFAASSSAVSSATVPESSASSAAPTSTFSTHTVAASSAAPPAYPTLSPTLGQGVSGPATGSSTPTGSSASSSGSAGTMGQCTTDGAIVCNGSTQFGVCDHGSVVWQAVAAGTTCSNGAILKRSQPVLPRHHARSFHNNRVL